MTRRRGDVPVGRAALALSAPCVGALVALFELLLSGTLQTMMRLQFLCDMTALALKSLQFMRRAAILNSARRTCSRRLVLQHACSYH
jgi:hypothetical protein